MLYPFQRVDKAVWWFFKGQNIRMGLYGLIISANSDHSVFFYSLFFKSHFDFFLVIVLYFLQRLWRYLILRVDRNGIWDYEISPFLVGFRHVGFLISTSISKFPFRNFFTFFGLDLLDIIFSIRKGDSWSNFISCSDSMMNLGKSLSVSDSESDKLWHYELDICTYMYTHVCVCTHTSVRVCVCMCVYVCVRPRPRAPARTCTYTHIYMWRDELDSAWVSNFKC